MRRQRQEFKIYPIDTKKATAVGYKVAYNNPGIFGQNYTTFEQVKHNLLNFLLTNEGERVFNLQFGGNLRALVFEPIYSLEEKKDRLQERIKYYFPYIEIKKLELTQVGQNTIYLSIDVLFNGQQDSLTVEVNNV